MMQNYKEYTYVVCTMKYVTDSRNIEKEFAKLG
jgi:hypothetical protein